VHERLLVPLDGSEIAERALPYAETLARKLNSEAILLTACAPGEPSEQPFRAYLEKKVYELTSVGVKASSVCIRGDAAKEILDFVEKADISLVIISTHGKTGSGVWAMGSIANKVLQRLHVPVLLTRTIEWETVAEEKEMRKILVPLDGSQVAEQIIPHVKGLAKAMDSEVILLWVVEPVSTFHFQIPPETLYWEKYEKEYVAQAERKAELYFGRKERDLRNEGVKVSSALVHGEVSESILQYADDNSASVIALATHGHSGVAKWIYGSVASKIIMGSSKPVLLVRPPLPKSGD